MMKTAHNDTQKYHDGPEHKRSKKGDCPKQKHKGTEHTGTRCHVDISQAIRLKLEHRVVHK